MFTEITVGLHLGASSNIISRALRHRFQVNLCSVSLTTNLCRLEAMIRRDSAKAVIVVATVGN